MARVVLLQLVIALMATMAAALLGGENAAVSSFLGGMCYVFPNALFAFGLHISERKFQTGTLAPFFFWEVVKIATTIASLIVVLWLYKDVNWLAFLLSFAISLKSYIFLLYRLKN